MKAKSAAVSSRPARDAELERVKAMLAKGENPYKFVSNLR